MHITGSFVRLALLSGCTWFVQGAQNQTEFCFVHSLPYLSLGNSNHPEKKNTNDTPNAGSFFVV
jgi:hypothetical protein